MTVTPSFVAVAPDSTGKKIGNVQIVNESGDTVYRQETVISSPSTAANRAEVSAQAALQTVGVAGTTGGASTWCATGGTGNALLTNAAVAVKTSAGSLYGVNFRNQNASDVFVQLFDLAVAGVTLGTTPPKLAFWVPAGGSWEEKFTGEGKIAFATAITIAATTTATGNTAPSSGILANIIYK